MGGDPTVWFPGPSATTIVQIVTRNRGESGAAFAGGRIVDERRLADRRVIAIQSKPDETSRSVGLDLAADQHITMPPDEFKPGKRDVLRRVERPCAP